MKPILIIGLILLFGGITYGASKSPSQVITQKDSRVISYSIIIGFILIILSGVLYLRK